MTREHGATSTAIDIHANIATATRHYYDMSTGVIY
jgi:hypothetical protein